MHVDRGAGRVVVGLALGLALIPAGADAEGLFGSAQVQYQRLEDVLFVLQPDGSTVRHPFVRELWLQSYDLNHRAYPRQNVLVQSTLRFNDQAVVGRSERQTTPNGSLRVLHPYANFFASFQPTLTRQSLVPANASGLDSANATSLKLQRREAQMVGRVAVPQWPTLDLSWIRRTSDPVDLTRGSFVSSIPGETSRQRSARLGYEREAWSSYASWSDQRSRRDVQGSTAADQRVLRAGGTARLVPFARAGVSASYDYTDTRSGFENARVARTRTHSADGSLSWQHTPRWTSSATSNLRRTVTTQVVGGSTTDFESALLTNWQMSPRARFTAGGGVRSVRLLEGTRYLSYVTQVAAADAQARPGWTVNALASNTVNWDPERGTYAVQSLGGSSRMKLGARGQLDSDLQVTANGDTGASPQRFTNAWGLRLYVVPLRAISATGSLRSYRVGPTLLRPNGVSRSRGLDLTWRPMRTFDLTGSYVSTGLLPGDAPRLVTRSATGRLSPNSSVQFSGTWSKSSQERVSTSAGQFSGREFASGRVQVAWSRQLSTSGGFTVANPGTDRSAKEYDAVLTWSFGR